MTLWLVLAALALVALLLVIAPLLRGRGAGDTRADYDLEVYLDQLRELDRDVARGLIGDAEATAARTEIERRLLAAERTRRAEASAASLAPRTRAAIAIILTVAIPAAALSLYLQIGSPGLPGLPFAERPADGGDELLAGTAMRVAEAEAAVRARPDDAQAWYDLGRIRFFAQQWARAAQAFAEAARLAPDRAEFLSAWGEALVIAAEGQVTAPARGVFERTLKLDANEPRARFYLALAAQQAGRDEQALAAFVALLTDAPLDAPWRPPVETRARALAAQLGKDADALLGGGASPSVSEPGPDAADVAAAAEMSTDERSAMVRSMVERLAARLEREPDDVEGWRRLGRSWDVLGEHGKSSLAYGRALDLEPDHPETLFRGALAAADAGDGATALARFARLRPMIPEGTEARDTIDRAIGRLEATRSGTQ